MASGGRWVGGGWAWMASGGRWVGVNGSWYSLDGRESRKWRLGGGWPASGVENHETMDVDGSGGRRVRESGR